MLTDAQVYCMTSMIYLFRPPLIAKAIYRKTAEAKLYTEYVFLVFTSVNVENILSASALEFGRDRIALTNLFKTGYLNFLSAFLVTIIVSHA